MVSIGWAWLLVRQGMEQHCRYQAGRHVSPGASSGVDVLAADIQASSVWCDIRVWLSGLRREGGGWIALSMYYYDLLMAGEWAEAMMAMFRRLNDLHCQECTRRSPLFFLHS